HRLFVGRDFFLGPLLNAVGLFFSAGRLLWRNAAGLFVAEQNSVAVHGRNSLDTCWRTVMLAKFVDFYRSVCLLHVQANDNVADVFALALTFLFCGFGLRFCLGGWRCLGVRDSLCNIALHPFD